MAAPTHASPKNSDETRINTPTQIGRTKTTDAMPKDMASIPRANPAMSNAS